ncbi:MAG: dihydroneopterin aldolase [Bacteroidales bacterium]|nr:dihydroneopterin aldolase [Bacteroidales bacterium]
MKLTKTTIHLNKVRFYAFHGVMPQEQRVGAYFVVSLEIETDFSHALSSDSLENTVSYADVYELVKEEMKVPSKLLEHVAGRIINRLYAEFPLIQAVHITLDKENPPMGAQCKNCGIEISSIR